MPVAVSGHSAAASAMSLPDTLTVAGTYRVGHLGHADLLFYTETMGFVQRPVTCYLVKMDIISSSANHHGRQSEAIHHGLVGMIMT